MDNARATTKDEAAPPELCKESKISIECLRVAKSSEDISIKNTPQTDSALDRKLSNSKTKIVTEKELSADKKPSKAQSTLKLQKENEISDHQQPSSESPKTAMEGDLAKIQTVFEKLNVTDSTVSGREQNQPEGAETNRGIETQLERNFLQKIAVPPLNLEIKGHSSEPQSDIFSTGTIETKRSANSLYSVKGSLSGRLNRKRDTSSNVFPAGCMGCKEEIPLDSKQSPRMLLNANDFMGHINNIPRKRPSSGKQDINRNPVTGVGMDNQSEGRRQSIRKKDGNPLLGTGYESPDASSTSSAHRIPPGGYSQGLW